jgi:tyrosine-protein kinase Etk/Wzc
LGAVKKYISRLTVVPAKNGGTGLLQVSVIDEVPQRAETFINVLIKKYNLSSQNYKNQAIQNALSFLGRRLTTVSKELDEEENKVRDFKAANKIYDVSASASELLGNLQSLDAKKTENVYQGQLLDLVESSIKNYSGNEDLVATASGLEDPVLGSQINAYNTKVMQKQTILSTGTPSDVRLSAINDQLADLRSNILKSINNIRLQFRKTENSYVGQENKFTDKFEALPQKEKEFIELNRY